MKKYIVAVVNVILIMLMMFVVNDYVSRSSRSIHEDRIREFEDVTVGMVQTTENYLYGAQQVADNWANYINANDFTIEEAIAFLRESKGDNELVNGQILFVGQYENEGLSTDADIQSSSQYEVKYTKDTLFKQGDDLSYVEDDRAITMTRMFTNQINGKQSVAFYHPITLRDGEVKRDAFVMYVIPVSEFEYNLKNSNSSFRSISSVIVTRNGDYISTNNHFKNSNVFEFLDSYNHYSLDELNAIKEKVTEGHGTFAALNSEKEAAYIAYASESNAGGFIVISMLNDKDIVGEEPDFTLPFTIGIGLFVLFFFNVTILILANNRLNHAVKEAEKASRAKTDFMSTMSHDIRTPLNAILGFTAIALTKKDDQKAVEKNLEQISMAGNHLLMLINDILDISQIENNNIRLAADNTAINDVMTTLRSIAQSIADDKKIHLTLETKNIIHPYVVVDALRLNQIYVNLVGNALKYTNAGGDVKMILEELPGNSADTVVLKAVISDTGIGMSKEFLPKMFEAFAREEDGRTSKVSGTGLGLAITKHLVDLMHGTITCDSELGKGTTFTVVVEVPIGEIPDIKEAVQPVDMKKDLYLLVAEDNNLNWAIVSEMLNMNGIKADRAVNGEDAIVKLQKNPDQYDLVLMDVRMPVLNGIEATKRIRQDANEKVRKIPVVAVTADAFTENITECMEAGMNAHVAKPIMMEDLLSVIAKVKKGV